MSNDFQPMTERESMLADIKALREAIKWAIEDARDGGQIDPTTFDALKNEHQRTAKWEEA